MSAQVIVGVVPGQPSAVVEEAARFARSFGVPLVCAHVDISRYSVAQSLDGTIIASSLDAEMLRDSEPVFDLDLKQAIAAVLEGSGVEWSTRALSGSPAVELARLAEEIGARMIVVGTREAGLRGSLREFFSGAVSVHLAHHQHRPVVMVPLDPKPDGRGLPWAGDD